CYSIASSTHLTSSRAYSAYALSSFSLYSYAAHRNLHSFPTRRSSDLSYPCVCATVPDRSRGWETQSDPATSAKPWSNFRCRPRRSEEHTSELQSRFDLVCRLLLEKKKNKAVAQI